ncbi:MAG: gliding motility protein GldL [Prevotellaceae bacterium]|jgi:gliding motility-associated protein GldL|nr:gliding motility protein GldL [Prevotellaceae bacterium]
MGLFSFIHGKTGRLILHRLYGWGAALVILGALFKLMHWQFAGEMLTIGMSTECIIFFLSAFEPMPKQYDWSLVYPEFAGDEEETRDVSTQTQRYFGGGGLNVEISSETNEQLKSGIEKLTNSLNQMSNLSGVVNASNALAGNMSRASNSIIAIAESANMLTDNYQKTVQTISAFNEQSKSSLEQIRLSYDNYRGQLNTLGNTLGVVSSSFELYNEQSKSSHEQIRLSYDNYRGRLDTLGSTLGAVNSSFELYLEETKKVQTDYSQLHTEIGALINNVRTSADQTQNFGNQMEGLNNNIGQLNSIYGSMLTAVNSVINK